MVEEVLNFTRGLFVNRHPTSNCNRKSRHYVSFKACYMGISCYLESNECIIRINHFTYRVPNLFSAQGVELGSNLALVDGMFVKFQFLKA